MLAKHNSARSNSSIENVELGSGQGYMRHIIAADGRLETCKDEHGDSPRYNTGCTALDLLQKHHAGHGCDILWARDEDTAIMQCVGRKALAASATAGGKEVLTCLCIVTLLRSPEVSSPPCVCGRKPGFQARCHLIEAHAEDIEP